MTGPPGKTGTVAALILAAGSASRMGRPKVLLPFRGETLARRIAREALGSGVGRVAVVVGSHAADVERSLAGLDIEIVVHPRWEEGLGSSIAAGLRHLVSGAPPPEAVVVLLADQPLVSSSSIDRLIAAREASGLPLAASLHGAELGVPALFASDHFPSLLALTGDHGAREILRAHGASAAAVDLPEARLDVDTPSDYESLVSERRYTENGKR